MASTPGVTYVAPNYGSSQSFRSNPNQYAIGVFDAAKNKLKVHRTHTHSPLFSARTVQPRNCSNCQLWIICIAAC